jgi:transposase
VELVGVLFPHLAGLHVERVFSKGASLRVEARARAASANCPGCSSTSSRVHSRYERRITDPAVGGQEAVIHLRVRRFFCPNADCARKTFVEQIPEVTVRHGRHSVLARQVLEAIALALGGRAGARLTGRLAVGVGRMTLIRLIRRLPEPVTSTPSVLGVDDFALRRGHRYGTVLINMHTRRPIDVLDDRTADTLATWLDAHPGVKIICRDRAGAYAEGAARGAPTAMQVADRWHLLKNLSDAVDKAVAHHRRCLQPQPQPQPSPAQPVRSQPVEGRLAQRTRARHAEIHTLITQGLGTYAISRRLGLDPKTVHRYADAAEPETLIEPNTATRTSLLDAHKPYLHQRCSEGVTGTNQLLAEIRTRGYRGSQRTLRRYLINIRGTSTTPPPPPPPPTSRDITTWIMRPASNLSPQDTTALEEVCSRCDELAAIRRIAREFADLVRERGGTKLQAWVEKTQHGPIAELRSFASGLRKDWDAVLAGLTHAWSSGAVEGNVNRIKMLKRQMYGRANTDLLRKRILLAT